MRGGGRRRLGGPFFIAPLNFILTAVIRPFDAPHHRSLKKQLYSEQPPLVDATFKQASCKSLHLLTPHSPHPNTVINPPTLDVHPTQRCFVPHTPETRFTSPRVRSLASLPPSPIPPRTPLLAPPINLVRRATPALLALPACFARRGLGPKPGRNDAHHPVDKFRRAKCGCGRKPGHIGRCGHPSHGADFCKTSHIEDLRGGLRVGRD